jgi:hypothetical protein
MNLPLQMPAVSRGRFSQTRAAILAERVFPSAQNLCNGTLCACTNGIVCCQGGDPCNCDAHGVPSCQGFGPRPLSSGHKHDHADVTCYRRDNHAQSCDCFSDES